MSTRSADRNALLSQERYLSSSAFAELQGISGTAVAKRCTIIESPVKRQLLWFIQGYLQGGCKGLAIGLLKMFPERVGTHTMHKLGNGNVQRYTGEQSCKIEGELDDSSDCTAALLRRLSCDASELLDDSPVPAPFDYGPSVPRQDLYAKCLESATERIPHFLTDLCINPALQFREGGKLGGSEQDSWAAHVNYFQDIIGALFEYKRRYEDQLKAEFCHTAISRQIWEQLDNALKTKTMIVIDGLEGRGKTEAVRAWCNCHLGVARFVSLDGTSTKTDQFKSIAKALGLSHSNARRVLEMQSDVQEVLQTSQLMIVVDEAHYFFNQSQRASSRPEMLDWIDTALCNPPLPVALITTPQFLVCMERAASPKVGWNYRQFARRCKRYCRLPEKNIQEDIQAVACHLLPGADKATIKQVMGYEALSGRDLSAVGDVVREANLLAEKDGSRRVTFEHVKRAIHEVLIPSDVPWAEMGKRIQQRNPGRKASRSAPVLEPEAIQEPPEAAGRGNSSRLLPDASGGHRVRFQEDDTVLACEPDEAILTPV